MALVHGRMAHTAEYPATRTSSLCTLQLDQTVQSVWYPISNSD
jgi:hypothetical protein